MRQVFLGLMFIGMIGINTVSGQEKVLGFNKTDFYKTMQSGKEQEINQELELVQSSELTGKDAFAGALLMKKAGMVNTAKKKLDLFKAGHKKLEAVLKKDSSNAEFRFLRLMVQEHAPGILGYKADLAKDRLFILRNFETLAPAVQQAIKNYSRESTVLKREDFNSIR